METSSINPASVIDEAIDLSTRLDDECGLEKCLSLWI